VKIGDLVVMPESATSGRFRAQDLGVGLIVNDVIVRNRIGVMWSDGEGQIDYEPVEWLSVISNCEVSK
tara:strand:- start:7088 stop:7291 length:204 start_codon:yes stop_codon:yes gene_type:complete